MTTKAMVIKEIEKLPENDPLLKVILEILQAYQTTGRKTPSGRPIRTRQDMANIDCPYPYEVDL
jgi:hypothetical protein